jgi:thiol-disulfide isomerase/thioredoxin
MPTVSKTSLAFLVVAFCILSALMYAVYELYLSPTSEHARENSDLGSIQNGEAVLYTDIDGNPVNLTSFKEDILIVNVWASWSPFTQQDHEVLSRLKNEFGERIVVRAVNRMESKETALAYLDTIGKHEGIEYVLDTTDHLYASQDGYAMPETLIFDRTGTRLGHIRGTLVYDEVRAQIQGFLERIE